MEHHNWVCVNSEYNNGNSQVDWSGLGTIQGNLESWETGGNREAGMVNNGGPGYLIQIGGPHTGTRYPVPDCRTRTLSL
jgi:hypothetical protein